MKNYQEWYDHIAGNIENKPFLLSLLRTFNRFMTVVMPMIYLTLLAVTYLQQGLGKQVGIYLFIPASGFVILSFLRKKINALRPYEVWEIVPLLDRIVPVIQCLVAMSFQQPSFPWLACMQIFLWGWFC